MTCNLCPLVLVSAGVGVTPLVSILHTVASENSERPVWFIHGARDGNHHPLAAEVLELVDNRPNINLHVAYSQPGVKDKLGIEYDSEGRVTGALLAGLVQNMDAHYFLCGPVQFMAEIQTSLEQQDVLADQIHFETFGPVG
jgi:ferredoxin-NADP reductase